MGTSGEIASQILTGDVHGPDKVRKAAIDALTLVAHIVLYDDLRPGRISARVDSSRQLLVHERHFALLQPPVPSEPPGWGYIPARLRHRARGYSSVTDQFALSLPQQETIVWNRGGDKVQFYAPDHPRIPLSTQAVIDVTRLLVSPLFINHDPDTGTFEYDMPAPYPEQQSHFPTGTLEEATAAFAGLTSYLSKAMDSDQQPHDTPAVTA